MKTKILAPLLGGTLGLNSWLSCYFTNFSQYRTEYGKYTPEDIDADLCTHLYYAMAKLCKIEGDEWGLCPSEWNDLDQEWGKGMYSRPGIEIPTMVEEPKFNIKILE